MAPEQESAPRITTLIFDVDDTLYDVGNGFTAHRNGWGALSFMVEKLGFRDMESAKLVREKYFALYHSTAKALTVADKEGQLPPTSSRDSSVTSLSIPNDLAEWWAMKLDFLMLGGANLQFRKDLESCPLKLVAFSNGPRKYVKRVLEELSLFDLFGDEGLFAVDDVLPHCKPEKEAFQIVLDAIGAKAEECVMIEDSMKNIRNSKMLGMKTVLVTGLGRTQKAHAGTNDESKQAAADAAEATKPGDAPMVDDPAVDISIEVINEMKSALPGLWETPASFSTSSKLANISELM